MKPTTDTLDVTPVAISDTDFLKMVLTEGAATTNEIIQRSFQERGCGLTVHSRAADLRRKLEREADQTVRCPRLPGRNGCGRVDYLYCIVPLRPEAPA
jgi:hypothetical protein